MKFLINFFSNSKNSFLGTTLLSGVLLGLSYSYFVWWLAWVALIPLFHVLNNSKKGFFWGFLAGFIQSLILLSWVISTTERFTGESIVFGVLLWLLLSLYLAIWVGFFGFLYVRLASYFKSKTSFGFIIVVSFFWILLEWIRIQVLPGIPGWNTF
jgi:apolipoprotein N-acyltransferase